MLKIALAATVAISIFIAIVYSFINGLDSERFPLTLIFNAVLLVPLLLTIYYGWRLVKNVNDNHAFEIIITISTIFVLLPLFVIYRFIQTPDCAFLYFLIISIFIVLLWVLNVKSYLSQKNNRKDSNS
ncbi:hypothetical protein [Daejeonella sp.]|uniref:hypothetical protein n=1 Tax=Daejeonella sp. TaxID=2805397 RepID=UPI0030BD6952